MNVINNDFFMLVRRGVTKQIADWCRNKQINCDTSKLFSNWICARTRKWWKDHPRLTVITWDGINCLPFVNISTWVIQEKPTKAFKTSQQNDVSYTIAYLKCRGWNLRYITHFYWILFGPTQLLWINKIWLMLLVFRWSWK